MSGIKLAQAPKAYDRPDQSQIRKALEQADGQNFKRGQDLRLEHGEKLIKKAQVGGARYEIFVDADGRLCTQETA